MTTFEMWMLVVTAIYTTGTLIMIGLLHRSNQKAVNANQISMQNLKTAREEIELLIKLEEDRIRPYLNPEIRKIKESYYFAVINDGNTPAFDIEVAFLEGVHDIVEKFANFPGPIPILRAQRSFSSVIVEYPDSFNFPKGELLVQLFYKSRSGKDYEERFQLNTFIYA